MKSNWHKTRPSWLSPVFGISFVIGGLIPTVPVFLSLPQAKWWAYGLTALTALVLGAIKARYTHQRPVWAGLEFLVVVTAGTLAGVGLGLLWPAFAWGMSLLTQRTQNAQHHF